MQRAANLADPKRSDKRRRGRAFAVVVLWLLGWSAWALQPCCEALAAVIPHHSQTDALPAHDGHDHPGHHDDSPATRDHTHCPSAKPVDLGIPTPVASLGSSYRVQTALYLPANEITPVPVYVARQRQVHGPRHRPPPPTSPPPFLVQRLLI